MSLITPSTMIGAGLLGAALVAGLGGVPLRDAVLTLLGLPVGLFALVVAEHLRTR